MSKEQEKIVIIGGGTAGLVIANNLQNNYKVTVIEKSKFKKYPLIYKIPLMIGLVFRNSKIKYINQTHIEINNGRKLPFFESNLLGGSSVMNGCVHMLGSKVLWEKFIQKYNIKYNEVLRSYNNLYSVRTRDKGKIILSKIRKGLIDSLFFRTLSG